MVGEILRKDLYWLFDWIKGGKVKQYYDDMMRCYHSGTDTNAQEKQLQRLLKHAVETTKYYSSYSNYSGLEDFPILTKAICRNNDLFFSNQYINGKNCRKVVTSGSTGIPLIVYHDPDKIARSQAAVIFFGKLCGYEIGMRQAYFRVWVDFFKRSKLSALKQNIYMVDVSKISEEYLGDICIQLQKQKVKSILSYSSALEEMSQYILKHNPDMRFPYVKSIVSCAEVLQVHTKNNLLKIFDCPVMSRYSNLENGIISHQVIDSGEYFYIDSSSYFIEILKIDSDEKAEEGEVGRIVLTDLYNFAYPLIRYDTGDTGVVVNENGRSYFKTVYGRIVDTIYGVNGEMLSPYALDLKLENEKVIRQYQFLQTGKRDYKLKINLEHGTTFNPEEAIAWLKSFLGEEANILVEFVDEIPIMASGKRKIFENLWKTQ